MCTYKHIIKNYGICVHGTAYVLRLINMLIDVT